MAAYRQTKRVSQAGTTAAAQRRRAFPARMTQAVQVNIHKAFARVFENRGPVKAPRSFKIAMRTPGVPWLLGYAVGMGVRPERVADARGRDRGRRSVERRRAPVATV